MNENDLANIYLRMLNRTLNEGLSLSQEVLWDLAKRMSSVAQPKKRYQDLYNSPQSRRHRKQLTKSK